MAAKLRPITENELRIMQILWTREWSTVSDILALLSPPLLAYTTVQTMLKVLEQKGHVHHKQVGRTFHFRAVTSREDATERAISHVLRHFFGERPAALALKLMEHEQISEEELRCLDRIVFKKLNAK